MQLLSAFEQEISRLFPAECGALLSALTSTEPVTCVRVNRAKCDIKPSTAVRVPWCPEGFILPERLPFTFDPDLHAGRYYVQDASSMFVCHVLRSLVSEPVRYLDLCAAPGGKTTAALASLPKGSLVVANEIVPTRARALCDNAVRWGNPACVVTNNSPAQLGALTHFFDIVAADVPCSGEGMMRKDAEAVAQWSPQLVAQCAERQRDIVAQAWSALRPGGLFVYSTCTFNRAENEDIVEHIISTYGAEPVVVPVEPQWNIHGGVDTDVPCYRFLPHRVQGEGLFLCVLRKPALEARRLWRPAKAKTAKNTSVPAEVKSWLNAPEAFSFVMNGDTAIAHPTAHNAAMEQLCGALNVLHSGITLAEAGRKLTPHHSLALSTSLAANAFPHVDVDYRTAIAYLRGEAVTLPDAPRGYVLVTHRKAPLGFANNLGNRANNLYPRPMRILSTHAPEQEPRILL